MKHKNSISILVLFIVLFSFTAAATGIFSGGGPGQYEFTSIHGEKVLIYGKGIYKDMSAEVAPQGIAQDVVTLFLGIPLLIISLHLARKGLLKGRMLLAGTLGYFLVTYLFYLTMGMYNKLFLVYVILLSTSFFAFAQTMLSFDLNSLGSSFKQTLPVKLVGGFLIFQSFMVGLLWLSLIVPPLLTGTLPAGLDHYTTLIVQGLDLAILLPTGFLSGVLLLRRNPFGYLLAPVFTNFLVLLMTALTAKVIGQMLLGVDVGFPVMIVIPLFNLTAIFSSILILKNVKEKSNYGSAA